MKLGARVSALPLGGFPGGATPTSFLIENGDMRVAVCDYGATVMSIWLLGRDGRWVDVLLGPPTPAGHANRINRPYFGATVGRFANRISGAGFRLGGREYALAANDGGNHLHGGLDGFDSRMWDRLDMGTDGADAFVALALTSPDGDQGYPGDLRVSAEFRLSPAREFSIRWSARSDAPTPLGMTSHGYFNLRGHGDILGHELTLAAGSMLPAGPDRIPLGPPVTVAGTPFDFREPKSIGRDIEECGGYDHCFVVDAPGGAAAARAVEPETGRWMELRTDMPGIQLYTGDFLTGTPGKGGVTYHGRDGFCLEPECFPDSPNRPEYPSCILEPGAVYSRFASYRFGF